MPRPPKLWFKTLSTRKRQKVEINMSRDRDRGDVARVYVGDLGSGGSKPELEREFERYGPLRNVWVARNPPGKLSILCLAIQAFPVQYCYQLRGKAGLLASICVS